MFKHIFIHVCKYISTTIIMFGRVCLVVLFVQVVLYADAFPVASELDSRVLRYIHTRKTDVDTSVRGEIEESDRSIGGHNFPVHATRIRSIHITILVTR